LLRGLVCNLSGALCKGGRFVIVKGRFAIILGLVLGRMLLNSARTAEYYARINSTMVASLLLSLVDLLLDYIIIVL